MTKTEHYQLPQWVESDRILMEDFNEAMGNIEKGIEGVKSEANQADAALRTAIGTHGKTCRIATGSFTRANGGSITVDFKPLVAFVSFAPYEEGSMMLRPLTWSIFTGIASTDVAWGDRTVTWSYIDNRYNEKQTYQYIVIGVEDD